MVFDFSVVFEIYTGLYLIILSHFFNSQLQESVEKETPEFMEQNFGYMGKNGYGQHKSEIQKVFQE